MGCYKQCYTKKQALTILNERKSMGKKWAKEVRVYECPICIKNREESVWHLTSKLEYFKTQNIPLKELIFKDEWEKLRAM